MKSLRITESFSIILLLHFVMYSFAEAQDLEEVLPKKVEVSVIDYSDDFEPSISTTPPIDSVVIDDFKKSNAALSNLRDDKEQQALEKEVQLGMILRNAYYQKITTPRWAKILSTESWRASFLKWRYYAQIEDYIRSSIEIVSEAKKDPSGAVIKKESESIESLIKSLKDSILINSKVDIRPKKETSANSKSLSVNHEGITEKDDLDTDSDTVVEEVFDFSISDLSLPDSLKSEQELFNKNLNPSPKDNDVQNELSESDPSMLVAETDENAKEEMKTLSVASKESKSTVEKALVVSEKLKSESLNPEQGVKPIKPKTDESIGKKNLPSPLISDRRSMTERFASKYRKLPWPVSGGVITDKYGYRKNAAARGLKSENYGIDISAPSSSRVNAVFSGTVLMAIKQAPYDYIVTLKHGDFTSAYYFLEKIHVQVGDEVVEGQDLGTLRKQEGSAPFHFEIWQDQERINPEPWLRP